VTPISGNEFARVEIFVRWRSVNGTGYYKLTWGRPNE